MDRFYEKLNFISNFIGLPGSDLIKKITRLLQDEEFIHHDKIYNFKDRAGSFYMIREGEVKVNLN
jgi:hypothetical protein